MAIKSKFQSLKRDVKRKKLFNIVIVLCSALLVAVRLSDVCTFPHFSFKNLSSVTSTSIVKKKFLYIYDVPSQFTLDLLSESRFELIPGTKYAQWQSEYYVHQILKKSTVVTEDPEKATIFFVPLYGSGMRSNNTHRSEVWNKIILWLNEQMLDSKMSYLERFSGADHVFVFGASRSWCKVSQPFQKVPKCLGLSHKSLFDSKYIKLTVEFPGLRQEHLESSHLTEKLSRIIVIPYMHYDVKSAFGIQFFESDIEIPRIGKRENLLYFSGSLLPKTAPFRAIFKEACDSFTGCTFGKTSRRSFNETNSLMNLQSSTFCAILGGDTRASKRFFDAVSALCIPVIFDPLLALPFMDSIPYHTFVVYAPFIRNENIISNTIMKLQLFPDHEIIKMQSEMKLYVDFLSYFSNKKMNAIDMIIHRLYMRGELIHKGNISEFGLVEAGLVDWNGLHKNICGPFGAAACKVYTQSVL